MSESNGSTKGNAPDKVTGTATRCPACGELYAATDSHVCSDGPTAGVVDINEPPPPPPSYFGLPPGEADPLVGTTLADRYLILSRVSQGGMGVVYKARHKLLNSIVAVKILLKQEQEIDQRRFLLEAQLASKLSHPNIVYISDFGLLPDGRPYLVMEFIEGPTLSRILRKSKGYRIDMLRACKIAVQIARGMQVVHDKGIVHRDLKPENIFVLDHAQASAGATTESGPVVVGKKPEDFVKIVDFGIAKDTGAAASTDPDAAMPAQMPRVPTSEELAIAMRPIERGKDIARLLASTNSGSNANSNGNEASQQSLPDPGDNTGGISGGTSGGTSGTKEGLTQIGASIGTPRYMAPEQVDGVGIEARSDQYALGCILYQMIGGSVPFSGGSSMALLSMHMFEKPKSLRERYPELNVPESLDALVLRMLAKSKLARFPSMRDVAAALEREIEVLSIQRGEKVAISSGLAALLGGRRGTHIIIRGVKLPLFAVVAVIVGMIGVLSLSGVLIYRRWFTEPTALKPGELQELEERARQVLLNDLSAPGPELRQGALMGLAQTHDGRYRTQLEASLRESSPQLQAQAAEALGQLGDRQAAPALAALLKASTALQVQLAAAQALSLLGDAQGQKFLEAALAGTSEEARLRAASLLCRRGNPKALELLSQAVEKGVVPEPLSLNFLACLTQAGNDGARQKLREQMRGSGQAAMLAAAKLAQLGQEDGRAFLRERIRQPGPEQLVAARFLSAPDEPQVAELFRQVLRDRRSGAPSRLLAAEGLGLSGQLIDARLLSDQLEPSREANVQLGAASSIILLARNEPGALSEQSMLWARGALADSQWAIRESAVAVIGDSTAPDAVPLLAKLIKDAHPSVRQSAVRALGRRREEDALLALRDALGDSEQAVRQESLRSLLRLSQSLPQASKQRQTLSANVEGWVKELAAKGTESEQTLARSLLFKLGDRSQLDALRELTKSTSADIRRLVIEQLGRELELLLSMLKDTVFAVRFGAARQLAEAGDKRAVPVLREAVERKSSESLLALALLRKLGEAAVIPDGLADTVSSGTLAERLAALDSASELPADAALALLRRLARDVSPQVRQRVAEVAAELPKQKDEESAPGVPILRLLATDSDAAVRARAATLLAPFMAVADKKPEVAAPAPEDLGATKAAENTKPIKAEGTAPTAGTEPARVEPAAPVAAGSQGSGSIVVEAAPLVTFQLDRGRWQSASKQAIPVAAGSHELASLSGVQTIDVADGKSVTVKIPESQIEKLTSGGLEAHEKKDLRKAQKLLEKASSLCSRERKHPQPCSELAIEINYHLGQIHESGERLPEAMTAYQKVVSGAAAVRGHEQQRAAAQSAIARMLPSLGLVVIPKKAKNKCQEVTLYMLPGTHMIEIDGDSQTVKVKAQETVRLGSCSE